jgi:hypothetical protein
VPGLRFTGQVQNDVTSSCRSIDFQRTANWVLTVCVSSGGNPTCHLGSSGGQALNEPIPMPWLVDTAADRQSRVLGLSTVPPQSVTGNYNILATRYINLIS